MKGRNSLLLYGIEISVSCDLSMRLYFCSDRLLPSL